MVAMDSFSYILDQAIHLHTYMPFYVGEFSVSHLLFANDLLVVEMANKDSLDTLNSIFLKLKSYLGIAVNHAKSCFYISDKSHLKDLCGSTLRIPFENLPFKYLGLPLARTTLNFAHFFWSFR